MPAGVIVLSILFAIIIAILIAFRRPLTRAVLVTTEVIVLMLVVLLTIAGAMAGHAYSNILGPSSETSVVLSIVGGIGGFVLAALLAFFVLTLAQIERNTRAAR